MRRYPKYKDSGIEWIGELPENWNLTRLKYLSNGERNSFIDGDWIESTVIVDDGIRYITTGNIGQGFYKEQGQGFISEETFNQLNCTEVFPGDLLISRLSPPVGRSCIIPDLGFRIVTSVDNVILRPSENINKFFLNYLFNYIRYQEWNDIISRGTTLTRISRSMLGNNQVFLPTLLEQNRIVQFLDQKTSIIDELIQKKQRKIELLKEQRTSIINHTVTKGLNPNFKMKETGIEWIGKIPEHWDIRKLSTFGWFSKGNGISREEIISDGLPCIRYGEIYTQYNRIVYSPESYISEESSFKSVPIQKGCVLFTGSGETKEDIGKSVLYFGEKVVFVGGDIIIFKLKDDLSPVFFSYSLNSQYVIYQKTVVGKGEIVVHIYSKDLKDIKISLPPISEQHQIVEYLDQKTSEIDTQIQLEIKKIDLLKEYRQSLISEVVTGKIDIRQN